MASEYIPGQEHVQQDYGYGGDGSLIDDDVYTPGTDSYKGEKAARVGLSKQLDEMFPGNEAVSYTHLRAHET